MHNGHLVAAHEVAKKLGLDRVIFVPAGNQWQKQGSASAPDRLAMVTLATKANPLFEVSDVDVVRGGATYTIDTLTDLQRQNPAAQLFFILGADALAGLASWKSPEQALDLAQFVVVTRPGSVLSVPDVAKGKVMVQEIAALNLSSTEFREAYAKGEDCSSSVPASVLSYIQAHGLYKESR